MGQGDTGREGATCGRAVRFVARAGAVERPARSAQFPEGGGERRRAGVRLGGRGRRLALTSLHAVARISPVSSERSTEKTVLSPFGEL